MLIIFTTRINPGPMVLDCFPKINISLRSINLRLKKIKSGDDLLFQGVTTQVPSALKSLTSVFEMGTGVASSLASPETLYN